MKGINTTYMKRLLLLIPLLLVGCYAGSDIRQDDDKAYINVYYVFNYDSMKYDVTIDDKVYHVKPSNTYNVYVYELSLTSYEENGKLVRTYIENKYYTRNNELFIFIKR